MLDVVQSVDGGLGVLIAFELDEAEALALPRVAIGDHVGAADGAELQNSVSRSALETL